MLRTAFNPKQLQRQCGELDFIFKTRDKIFDV
jgi:hypothetical protein